AKKLLYVVEKFDSPYTSNNSILEIIINERITMCDMYNINFEYNIRYDDLSFINDMDLVSLLSNLLNNAVEATEKIQNGYVNLVIDRFNDFLVINVTNPYINIKKDIKGKFKTTKEDHHGVGLVNIRNIIKLYSGEISINTENNVFEVKIIIPIKTTVS
ncbi:MAG: GHKL domain-containing protein, partial [Erysipelotrichaceae bacterium]